MLHIRTFILLLIALNSLSAREIPQKDIDVHIAESVRFGKIDAKMVHFGGYTTPECKLAVSLDGNYFYLKKVNSTCTTLTNSKGVKIICNRDKSVCKTRQELADLVNNRSVQTEEDPTTPSWCNAGRLNKTEHMICADETLGKLDKEMAKVYGATKAYTSDSEQKEWLEKRNQCKTDIACIRQAYKKRLAQLNQKNTSENSQKVNEKVHNALYNAIKVNSIKLCNSGHYDGCNSLGVIYYNAKGVKQDYSKAAKLFAKACDGGDIDGCSNFGKMYANGEIEKQYHSKAVDFYIGEMYEYGTNGIKKNYSKAARFFVNACNSGSAEGCYRAGKIYAYIIDEESTKKDYSKIVKFYTKACDAGNGDGCFDLAIMYENGEGVKKDYSKAVKFYTKACDNRNSDGCLTLGSMYRDGEGIKKDYSKAIKCYTKACDNYNFKGCKRLKNMYREGKGTKHDYSQLNEHFKEHCHQGSSIACKLYRYFK